MTTPTTIEHTDANGRLWILTAREISENLAADLRRRGWNGVSYFAESEPKGRQRKRMIGLGLVSADGSVVDVHRIG